MAEAKRDNNYVPTLIGVSNADGTTPVVIYADPTTHRLLVDTASGGGAATTALSNLASVAINTSLISDTALTDDLGTEAIPWRKLYLGSDISFEGSTDNDYQTTLRATDPTADNVVTIPDGTGTLVLNPMTTGGDLIYGGASGAPTRLANGTAGQVLQSNGTTLAPSWASVGTGDVVGPGSATDNAIARFDTTTGKLIQNSAVTIADTTGVIAGTQGVTISGATSGTIALVATAIAGTNTVTLPAATGTVALTANKLSAFAATSSAELAGVISDETGSGALVFANTPTLVTRVLGVAGATSLAITGTAGAGYLTLIAQASNPSSPAAGTLLLHSTTTQGFTRLEQDNEAGTNIILGRDSVTIVKNTSGGTINKGEVVYLTGSTGNVPNIAKAQANSSTTLPAVYVVVDNIDNNAFGQVMRSGIISGFDTSAFSTGASVWLSATVAGGLTATRPSGTTNYVQRIGTILVSGVGSGSLDVQVAPAILNMETGTTAATWTGSAIVGTTITANTGLMPDADDGAYIGQSGTGFSDLFLASGGVINWAAGNATLTHSTGLLTSNVPLSLGTSNALTAGTIELGHATANTLSASGGVLSVEGVAVLTVAGGTLTGGINLGENAGLVYDAALSADGKYSGLVRAGTAGATLAFGDLVYLAAADSRWELADADAASTAGDVLLGMCVQAAAADGDPTTILMCGFVRADAVFPAMTISAPMYVDVTAGDITGTKPSGTDDVVRRVGFAYTADELYFNPSNDFITIV